MMVRSEQITSRGVGARNSARLASLPRVSSPPSAGRVWTLPAPASPRGKVRRAVPSPGSSRAPGRSACAARPGFGGGRLARPPPARPKSKSKSKSRSQRSVERCVFFSCWSTGVKALRFASPAARRAKERPGLDSPCKIPNMKTQRGSRPSCCWCLQPVSRPHLQLLGPSVKPGMPHRWFFCSLLCLQAWCVRERAHHLREQVIERAMAGDARTPGGFAP